MKDGDSETTSLGGDVPFCNGENFKMQKAGQKYLKEIILKCKLKILKKKRTLSKTNDN